MDATIVYRRTPKGEDEIKTRAAKLAPKLRTMLIMIDGTKTAGQLQPVAERLGLGAEYASALEQDGFISLGAAKPGGGAAPAAPKDEVARFSAAQRFMNDTAVNALGMRSFFFTLKVERCASRAELSQLLEEYSKVITKGAGAEEAAVLGERMRELLA